MIMFFNNVHTMYRICGNVWHSFDYVNMYIVYTDPENGPKNAKYKVCQKFPKKTNRVVIGPVLSWAGSVLGLRYILKTVCQSNKKQHCRNSVSSTPSLDRVHYFVDKGETWNTETRYSDSKQSLYTPCTMRADWDCFGTVTSRLFFFSENFDKLCT